MKNISLTYIFGPAKHHHNIFEIFGLLGIEYLIGVRPVDLQQIGDELAIKWDDGKEQFILLETLRRACPCAGCKGEVDVMGKLHKGLDIGLTINSFRLHSLQMVGTYAIKPTWADGHATGLFSFDYLRKIGDASVSGG